MFNDKCLEIRIVLVDDQSFVRHFLEETLTTDSNLKIVGKADNGYNAIAQIQSLQPNIVLIDLEMPEMDGVTATKIIVKRFPNCKILVLTSHEDGESLQKALRAGANGYLIKGSSRTELINAVYSVSKGYTQLSPGLLEKVLTPPIEILSATPEETEVQLAEESWSESTRETIETLPRVSLRAILYILLMFTTIVIPWIMLAKVDEIGTARGKLEPLGKTISLDASVTGTVTSIAVQEGQKVTQGQTLLQLESELITSELQQQKQKLVAQQNQVTQLNLLKNQQSLALSSQEQQNQAQELEKQSLIDQAQQNLTALRASYNNQIAEKYSQLEQAKEAINTSKSAQKLAKIRWENAQEKSARYQEAYQQGIIPQERFLEAQQTTKENQESMSQAASEIAQAEARYREQENGLNKLKQQVSAEIKQAELQLQEQERSYQALVKGNKLAIIKSQEVVKNTESQIIATQGEISQIQTAIQGLEVQLKQRIVNAPVTGIIFELPIQKPGAVVQPGQRIAQIAAEDSPLILRARMSSKESGLITKGLPVKLKFDAYPFQDYGIISGRLTWISPDSKTITESTNINSGLVNNQTQFYELEVTLDRNYILTSNRQIFLTPGQTATAEVVIRQRRLIDVFLEPFKSLKKGGLQL